MMNLNAMLQNHRALILGIAALVAAFPIGAAESKTAYSIETGLIYSDAFPGLSLDLLLPKTSSAKGRLPCVLVIQGGGFSAQDGQKFRPFAVYLAERGFAAALIAYRGRPNHRYQDTIADAKTAVRYIRKTSGHFGIDPDRIGAVGGSAGGTITGLLAVTDDTFEAGIEYPEYSSRIQAAVIFAGVFDFVARFTDDSQIALQPNIATKIDSNGEWIGPRFSASNEDWIAASCVSHIDNGDPPILLIHSKDDSTVPWLQSQGMHEAMRKVGIASMIQYYETGGHGFWNQAEPPKADMLRFFTNKL